MGAPAVISGILPQFQKLLDVQMPGFQVRAHRAFALATLINRYGSVVHYFEKGHDSLRFPVRSFDMRTKRAHRSPVVTQSTGELRQERVFLDGLVDAFQVIRDRCEVATGQLRALSA